MIGVLWFKGLLHRMPGRLAGAIAGIALTVALLASIGTFIVSSASAMTQRVIAGVPVDWQIQMAPGANVHQVIAALDSSTKVADLQRVGYADVAGFKAATGGTVQTTGPGKAVGVSSSYRTTFPSELRQLIGSPNGVELTQQTAANLHAVVGDKITIERIASAPVQVRVDGVVDLPHADSLFQSFATPAGIAPQAPPDNVILLPAALWHKFFDRQSALRPDSVRTQLHVRIAHDLPHNPGRAYVEVQRIAKSVEAKVAGSAIVGNNLAATLLATQADALYAGVLFLFLGVPGAVLAALLTFAITASGAARRRRDQALLRIRGAATAQVLRLEALEAIAVAIGGVAVGIALAYVAVSALVSGAAPAFQAAPIWPIAASCAGLVIAILAVLYPAWKQARSSTVVSAFAAVGEPKPPLWQQAYLDVILLALSAVAFWQTASTGYQVVVAPEGVPQTTVHYQAFLAPLLLWCGVGLLTLRLAEAGLGRGRAGLAIVMRPYAGSISGIVAASLARQRRLLSGGIVLVALAVSFAVSTAVFNATFNAQSRIDAELTNGADVSVSVPPSSDLQTLVPTLSAIPGVSAKAVMMHRFAYVGNDLQDIYGIDPLTIGNATNMSNAFFASGNAKATLAALHVQPDGVLVSEETVRDFALKPGDLVNLRLQKRDHRYHVVPFHLIGVVREFPTAPKDSFLVTNADYIAKATGSNAVSVVLLRAGKDPIAVARKARAIAAALPGANASDIASTRRKISSSLTAIDLGGLSSLELVFAILFVAAATGLVFALGLAERRRTFAILTALGAKPRQLAAFVWSEALLLLIIGGIAGAALGLGVAQMLVKLLTGVFDPPPESLAVPWAYIALLVAAAIASTAIAAFGALLASRHSSAEAMRE